MTTTLSGFKNAVHDAQQTFRGLLDALAHPGQLYTPKIDLEAPEGLMPLCAAACLTLFDWETVVWVQPTLPVAVRDWLRFHTGTRFTAEPQAATFAVINDAFSLPNLKLFNWGSAEDPEQSTTLLIQIKDFTASNQQTLSGPGILKTILHSPSVPETFWQQWRENHGAYPRGVDCFFLSEGAIAGLPRTTQALSAMQES